MDWLALYNRNLLQAELEKIRKTDTSLSELSRRRLMISNYSFWTE